MIFLDAVAYILQKEGNRARLKKTENYPHNMEIFSARHPANKNDPCLFTYVKIERSIPMPLNINSEILDTNWEMV